MATRHRRLSDGEIKRERENWTMRSGEGERIRWDVVTRLVIINGNDR